MRIVNQSRLIDIRRAVDIFVLFAAGFFTSWILSHIHTSVSLPSEMMGIVVLVTQFLFLAPVVARERYWRNVSAYDALAIAKSLMLSGGLLAVAVVVVNFGDNFIKATHLLFWLLLQGSAALILLCGVRLLRRMLFERQSTHQSAEHGKRTLIYGTSSSSRSLAFRFSQDPSLGIRLIGFVTHDPVEVGSKLSGVSVLGTGED
ncbi:MAG: nucleoside-diphosphate sugar epimerase/dehydratase, partial [Pseudobdellovibrionaceae bacterium]